MHSLALLFSAVFFGLCPAATAAEQPAWSLRAEGLTEFPIDTGAAFLVEGPRRLRVQVNVGYLLPVYLRATNSLLVSMFGDSGYSRDTADLVESSLKESLSLRVRGGWRPFASRGLYFAFGYGVYALGGSVASAELIEALTGTDFPDGSAGGKSFNVDSTLHMFDVEAGWEWKLWRRLVVRAAVGGAFTFASTTRIEAAYEVKAPRLIAAFEQAGVDYLNDIYTSYVHTPYVALAAGYAF